MLYCVNSLICVNDICFFFKQKTAYEMRISDWSSDVCSSDLRACRLRVVDGVHDRTRCRRLEAVSPAVRDDVGTGQLGIPKRAGLLRYRAKRDLNPERKQATVRTAAGYAAGVAPGGGGGTGGHGAVARPLFCVRSRRVVVTTTGQAAAPTRHKVPPGSVVDVARSEEHTSELQSLMRISYA